MHAYGHQWTCQIIFGPRFCIGLALTDGEGVERIWALLCILIAMERRMGVSLMCSIFKIDCLQRKRRLWILDRRIQFICSEHRDTLGDWIH